MCRRSAARRRLPSSRITRNKRSFSSTTGIVMRIPHHGNHEPALAAGIEDAEVYQIESKQPMKTQPFHIDLTQRPPRSFRVRLGNYVILARMLDNGRATLAQKN